MESINRACKFINEGSELLGRTLKHVVVQEGKATLRETRIKRRAIDAHLHSLVEPLHGIFQKVDPSTFEFSHLASRVNCPRILTGVCRGVHTLET